MSACSALVGKDIPVHSVVSELLLSPSYNDVLFTWKRLAIQMDVPLSAAEKESISNLHPGRILMTILEKWVNCSSQKPTLQNLIGIFQEAEMNDCAECLTQMQTNERLKTRETMKKPLYSDTLISLNYTSNDMVPLMNRPEPAARPKRRSWCEYLMLGCALSVVFIILVVVSSVLVAFVVLTSIVDRSNNFSSSLADMQKDGTREIHGSLISRPLFKPVINSCNLDCDRITKCQDLGTLESINWKGQINAEDLISVMSEAPGLLVLQLEMTQCTSVNTTETRTRRKRSLNAIPKSKVQEISLINFSGSANGLAALTKVELDNLRVLNIDKSNKFHDGLGTILELIRQNQNTLEKMSLNMEIFKIILKDKNINFPNLIDFSVDSLDNGTVEIPFHFGTMFPRIKRLAFKSVYISLNDLQKLNSCRQLQELEAKITVPSEIDSVKLADLFRTKHLALKILNVSFYFESNDGCDLLVDGPWVRKRFTYRMIQAICKPI